MVNLHRWGVCSVAVLLLAACGGASPTAKRGTQPAVTLLANPQPAGGASNAAANAKPALGVTLLFRTPVPTAEPQAAADAPTVVTPAAAAIQTPIATATLAPATETPPASAPLATQPVAAATRAAIPFVADNDPAQLLALHNQARSATGLALYTDSPVLQIAAQIQAEYLATLPQQTLFTLGSRGHTGADGSTPQQRAVAAGYSGVADENWVFDTDLASGFEFWLTDQFHRPQVLSARYVEVGFGVAPHAAGGKVYVAVYGAPR